MHVVHVPAKAADHEPAAQTLQVEAATPDHVPALHARQLPEERYAPAGHAEHDVDDVAPTTSESEPAEQFTQVSELVAPIAEE